MGKDRLKVVMCPHWGSDLASGYPWAQKTPSESPPPPSGWGVYLDGPEGADRAVRRQPGAHNICSTKSC